MGLEEGLVQRLVASLAPKAREALAEARRLAQAEGWALYLVGGAVRDLLLGRPQIDLDLALEGDATALAWRLAEARGGRALFHAPFGTASVRGQGFALDLARTRREFYPRPGALPRVSPAAIDEDLARRDFTINALALALGGPREGDLLDPFGGRRDLAEGLVRVLHEGSFIDDATRILRALRYGARLGFRLEPRTRELALRDRRYLEGISGARLRRELLLLLAETAAEAALSLGQELGVLAQLHPSLALPGAAMAQAREAPPAERPLVRLCLLAQGLSLEEMEALARRLALTRRERGALLALARLQGQREELEREGLRPSAAVRLLAPHPLGVPTKSQISWGAPVAALWGFALSAGPRASQRARRYLEEWRYVKPILDGRGLQALGVPPGPALGRILQALREARLDGRVRSRDEEEALARRLLSEQGEGRPLLEEGACAVCREPLDEVNGARCDICGQPFHLVVRRDRPGKDCGAVRVTPPYFALSFVCGLCAGTPPLGAGAEAGGGLGEPDIVDADFIGNGGLPAAAGLPLAQPASPAAGGLGPHDEAHGRARRAKGRQPVGVPKRSTISRGAPVGGPEPGARARPTEGEL